MMRKEEGSTPPKEMKERQTSLETSDSNFKTKGGKNTQKALKWFEEKLKRK